MFTLICASPVLFFGRHRAHWERRDLLGLILPFLVWLSLMLTPWVRGKTSGNALAEGLWLSVALVIAACVRVWMSNSPERRGYFWPLLFAVCLVGPTAFAVMRTPNKRGAGKGGITVLSDAGRAWPALPDRERWV